MSDLENAARPILTGMIDRTLTYVPAGVQPILAAWAAKTASAYDLTHGDVMVPESQRRWMAEQHTAPPMTTVLLARYGGRRYPLMSARLATTLTVEIGDQAPQPARMYLVSISVRPVVFRLLGHGIPRAAALRPKSWKADFAEVIWPETQPLPWPLPRPLGDDGLRRFAHTI